jgi:hypothetical protein
MPTTNRPPISSTEKSIVFNGQGARSLIVAMPAEEEVVPLLEKIEVSRVQNFWRNVVCVRSPYMRELPAGLATSRGPSLTLVSAPQVLLALTGTDAKNHPHVVQELRRYSFKDLSSVLTKLTPRSLKEALSILSSTGQMRLSAFSLSELYQSYPQFDALVRALEHRAIDGPNRQFASLSLVAMRGSGWVVLSGHIYHAVAISSHPRLQANAPSWDFPPLVYAGPGLQALYNSLLPNNSTPESARIHNTKAMLAVLCTNLKRIEELTWNVAEQLLRESDAPEQSRKYAATTAPRTQAPVAMASPSLMRK